MTFDHPHIPDLSSLNNFNKKFINSVSFFRLIDVFSFQRLGKSFFPRFWVRKTRKLGKVDIHSSYSSFFVYFYAFLFNSLQLTFNYNSERKKIF